MAQQSLYDLMNGVNSSGNPDLGVDVANPQAVISKQHFVYHFSGKSLDTNIWTAIGSGTNVLDSDGFALTPSSGSMNVSFGNKRQYDKQASRCIWVSRLQKNTAGSMYLGMWYDSASADTDQAGYFIHPSGVALKTADGTTSYTNTSDDGASGLFCQSWNAYEVENLTSSCNGIINGVLNATKTTNLSRQHFQPMMWVFNGSVGRAKYCEAWNT